MRIADELFWYPWQGRGNNCNTYLVDGEIKVLIDPGHVYNEFREGCLDQLLRSMATDGFEPEQIGLILCTHGHPDHCESAGIIRERSGARLALHREDEFFLEALERRYASAFGQELPSLKPDFYLQEGELEIGTAEPREIQVLHTPGHSPGCVCFYLPGPKALLSGDTVFKSSVGRSDLPGGNGGVLKKSLERLAGLQPVEMLLPGHMNLVSGEDKVRRNFRLIRGVFF